MSWSEGSIAVTPELNTIVEGIKFSNSLVKSGMGHITVEYRYGTAYLLYADEHTDRLVKVEAFIAFEGSKVRLDRKKTFSKGNESEVKTAFDGEKVMKLQSNPSGPIATILPSTSIEPSELDPRWWGTSLPIVGQLSLADILGGIPIRRRIRTRSNYYTYYYIGDSVRVVGSEDVNGEMCYVVDLNLKVCSENSDTTVAKYRLWINPAKGYMTSKIKATYTESITWDLFSFREYPGAIWFVKKGIHRIYIVDKETGEKELMTEAIVTLHDDFKVNIDVPDELFELDFPEGLPVFDERTGKTLRWPGE